MSVAICGSCHAPALSSAMSATAPLEVSSRPTATQRPGPPQEVEATPAEPRVLSSAVPGISSHRPQVPFVSSMTNACWPTLSVKSPPSAQLPGDAGAQEMVLGWKSPTPSAMAPVTPEAAVPQTPFRSSTTKKPAGLLWGSPSGPVESAKLTVPVAAQLSADAHDTAVTSP